jgi:hypothetical protein
LPPALLVFRSRHQIATSNRVEALVRVGFHPNATWPLYFSMLAVTNLVYQVEVAHLDPLRLLLVGSVLELTCLVFQIPTGLFADAFSRLGGCRRYRCWWVPGSSSKDRYPFSLPSSSPR